MFSYLKVYYFILSTFGLLISIILCVLPKIRRTFKERSGGGEWNSLELLQKLSNKKIVWFHAASVGEVNGVAPFIDEFRDSFPDYSIIISTTSETGKAQAEKLGYNAALFPFDYPRAVSKVISKIKPEIVVINETEIWPVLFYELNKRNIPLAIVNGRISDYSWPRYKLHKKFFKEVLSGVFLFALQSEKDKERYIALGANPNSISVTGSTKYDKNLSTKVFKEGRSAFGLNEKDPVFVAGSIHPGEWETVVQSYILAKKEITNLQLILAPRHPEKFKPLEEFLNSQKLDFNKRSDLISSKNQAVKKSILLLDTLGELNHAYSLSTISFLGGTLIKLGGHNPLEPAEFGLPVILGPFDSNIQQEVSALKDEASAFTIESSNELKEKILVLLNEPEKLKLISKSSKEVVNSLKGASKTNAALFNLIIASNFQPDFSKSDSFFENAFLSFLSGLYGLITKARNACYDRSLLQAYKSSLPVICLGNVTVGGSGKTPVSAFISKMLLAEGKSPVILSRGYKGSLRGPHLLTSKDLPEKVGDEALMQFQNLSPDVKIVISKNRSLGAKYIENNNLGDVIILDDGYQHRKLERDLNILLVDLSEENFINRWKDEELLPLGRFREDPFSATQRSDLVIFVIRKWLDSDSDLKEKILFFSQKFKAHQLAFLEIKPGKAFSFSSKDNQKDLSSLKSGSVLTALANPLQFVSMLKFSGVEVLNYKIFPDHFLWSEDEIQDFITKLPGPIITTEKDATKLGQLLNSDNISKDDKVWVSSLEVDFFGKETQRILQTKLENLVNS